VTPTLDALARRSGTFLMVAMDQRESLRTMMAAGADAPVPDERLVAFKLAVARELGPYASGFLIDRRFGFDRVVRERLLPEGCGLLLAADALVQPSGGAVEDTDLDTAIDPDGAVALKLLVIWRDDPERERRLETSRRFVELAESLGLLSVLEGVVRVDESERDAAIVEAARELSSVGPSLYKVEVPGRGRGDPGELVDRCREIDAAVPMPWVVLSNGVELADFPAAVEAACHAGASGMLAGRAIWSDVVGADDPAPLLRERSVPRLGQLAAIVDAHGRPWREKVP
jgi:sulfofructosephosphate aldolase